MGSTTSCFGGCDGVISMLLVLPCVHASYHVMFRTNVHVAEQLQIFMWV